MTIPGPELPTMRLDISGLISDWGISCKVHRKPATRNVAGQVSGSIVSVGTELVWLQPYAGRARGRGESHIDPGILDKSTVEAFVRYSGVAMQVDDRLVATGQAYEYDVLSVQVLDTHQYLWLQQVKRK